MALIKCPECGGEISDKAPTCIHCGFPMNPVTNEMVDDSASKQLYTMIAEGLNEGGNLWYTRGVFKDMFHVPKDVVSRFPYESDIPILDGIEQCNIPYLQHILDVCGCQVRFVPSESGYYNEQNAQWAAELEKRNTPATCPRCGSTQITTGQRGFSLLTGFLGSNKTVNRCAKCGLNWNPTI